MSQYRIGTVAVTNGSAIVNAVDPDPSDALVEPQQKWMTEVNPGYLFVIPGDDILYTVLSIESDTSLTLDAVFAGNTTTVSGVPALGDQYAIVRDFSLNYGFPLVAPGDVATAIILKKALDQIDSEFVIFNTLISGPVVPGSPTPPPPPQPPPGIDSDPPSIPDGLTATGITGTSLTLSWNSSTDVGGGVVAGYKVFRDGVFIQDVLSGTQFLDSGLLSGTTYTYTVSAFDNATQANTSAQSDPYQVTTI